MEKDSNIWRNGIGYTSAIGLADQNRQITGKFDGGITQTPQVFIDCQAMDGDFGLQINWDVREGVFPDGMIDDMFDLFQQRIEELAKDETDWNKINGLFLPQWQADERNVANHTETDLPIHLLQSGFMEWAQKAPDRVAVTDGEKKLTYGELHQYALKIRQKIVNVGAKHQDCIAIAMNKSIYQVAAVLGTLYAGCIYVPIVADQEIERAKKILEITNANIVLTTVAENSEYMSGKAIIEVDALSDIKFETELPEYGLEDVAYIIFTSGSTGEPKGVTITHAAAVNTIEDINNKNKVTCDDSVLGLSKLNFDLSVYDIFELGGDSIKAQRIVRKIADNFKVKISFLTVIHSKNVAEFSKEVEKISLSFKNSKKDEATSVGSKQDNQNVFPLTGVQLAYLNGRNDNYELGKYNAHYYFEAETEYTANQIEYAIRKEVSRHDALRTIFYKNGRQKILNNVPDYSVIVTKCQNDEEKEIELQKQRKILSHKVYDHEKWPLFTFQMIESPNSRILMVSLDLMVCDGDSMQILFTEIADTLEGKSDAEKIEYSYAEYIQNISNQKNSESYEEDKAYWLNKIDSLSSYPQIPMKMKLADCRDYNIVRKSAIIDSVLWGNFKETARRHKVSPSALLCTLYGRTMAKWGNQSEVLLNLTVFQRQQKNTGKIIGDFTKLLPLNLVFAKEDIWKSAEMVQEQIMKDLDHLSFDGTEIMRELAKRRGVFGKALLPVVFTCVLFDCPENYFERLGSIKYAVSQTPQVFLDNQITEMGGRLHISWDVVDELFEACIIDEIFLEFVEDIKRISENNKANSTNDFVTKVWGNILTKEIITKSVVPDLLKSIDLKQIKILDYAQELCPPDVKGQVYVSESEIMNDRNKTYYKILEHPLYGRMADTGIIGVLTHDGYMEFVVPNCETSVETPDKKEDTHEEEIEKPIVKEIMKIWKEVFEIEDISIQDDFYTLGGDSIILMRLVDEMCKTLGCDVTVDDILQSENISDLANRV